MNIINEILMTGAIIIALVGACIKGGNFLINVPNYEFAKVNKAQSGKGSYKYYYS